MAIGRQLLFPKAEQWVTVQHVKRPDCHPPVGPDLMGRSQFQPVRKFSTG
jgi:hypothetical protein